MIDDRDPVSVAARCRADRGGARAPRRCPTCVARRLLAQRVVLLHGPLDDFSVTRVSAELMTLDAEGDEPVTLRVDCGEAALAPALTLMDVIELMGVPVHALCLGQVGGGAVGVVAVCSHRSALPSTRFSLSEPTTQLEAHVRNVTQWAELRAAERQRFCGRVGRPPVRTRPRWSTTCSGGASSARTRRWRTGSSTRWPSPDAPIRQLPGTGPPPMGFRPLR